MRRTENPSYGPGNADYEYDQWRDRNDAEATSRAEQEAAEKRRASGFSPELLSIQDAWAEGQRAGGMSLGASMNPYQDSTPEHDAWERGRFAVVSQRCARMVA